MARRLVRSLTSVRYLRDEYKIRTAEDLMGVV